MARKQKPKNQRLEVEIHKGTIIDATVMPVNNKGHHAGNTDYEIAKVKFPERPKEPIFITSAKTYDKNDNLKSKAPLRVHRTEKEAKARFPRITPAFKKLR